MWNIRGVVNRGDYLNAIIPEHPNATVHGYVLLHRAVMEISIGRILTDEEVVHHIDHNPFNNAIDNLQLITRVEHSRLHGYEQGKQMVVMQCPQCGTFFYLARNKSSIGCPSKPYNFCSRQCSGAFYSYVHRFGLDFYMQQALDTNIVFEFIQYNSTPQ